MLVVKCEGSNGTITAGSGWGTWGCHPAGKVKHLLHNGTGTVDADPGCFLPSCFLTLGTDGKGD